MRWAWSAPVWAWCWTATSRTSSGWTRTFSPPASPSTSSGRRNCHVFLHVFYKDVIILECTGILIFPLPSICTRWRNHTSTTQYFVMWFFSLFQISNTSWPRIFFLLGRIRILSFQMVGSVTLFEGWYKERNFFILRPNILFHLLLQ